MTICDPFDSDAIQRRHTALRRLAASLVVVPEDAEDVVQDTWLAALSRRAGSVHNPDGWLHRVVRYQAARRRRKDGLRRERELRAARSLQLPEAEGRGTSARLLEALAALREPYRSVVLLRFEEELLPEAIAKRLERPVTTVKSQLNRGLKQIRARLPELEEERPRRWGWFLLPGSLRRRDAGLERLAASWVALSAAGCLLLVVSTRGNERDDVPALVRSTGLVGVTGEALLCGPLEPLTARRVPVTSDERALPAAAPRAGLRVEGIVADRDGKPVPEARIWVAASGVPEDAVLVARAGHDGRFRLEDVAREAWISAEGDGWLRSGWTSLPTAAPIAASALGDVSLRVVATQCRIAGVVRDASGRPLQGARIRVLDDRKEPWLHEGSWKMPGSEPGPASAADGTFELDTPFNFSKWLLVTAPDHAPALVSVLSEARTSVPVEVVLVRGETLGGQASFAGGEPAENASVEFRSDAPYPPVSTRVAADGSFELEHLPLGPGTLVVLAPDGRDALSHWGRLDVSSAPGPVRAVLGQDATIAGSATDARGRPLAGWTVAVTPDGERCGTLERLDPSAERSPIARTDEHGRFTFGGLPPLAHRLHLFAPGAEDVARATVLVPQPAERGPVALVAADELSRLTGSLRLDREDLRSCALVARSAAQLHDRYASVDPGTGAFAFEGLLPGSYELSLWDPRGPPTRLGTYRVEGETVRAGRVGVPGKGSLELSIRARDGRAVEPAVVLLNSLDGYGTLQALPEMRRSSPGEIATRPIRAGSYRLVVKARGYADFEADVEIEHPRQPLEIVLEPGAFVVVWVGTAEMLTPGQEIHVRAEVLEGTDDEPRRTFVLRMNPDRTIWNLPFGKYRLHASVEGGAVGSTLVELRPRSDDQPYKVKIRIPERSATEPKLASASVPLDR